MVVSKDTGLQSENQDTTCSPEGCKIRACLLLFMDLQASFCPFFRCAYNPYHQGSQAVAHSFANPCDLVLWFPCNSNRHFVPLRKSCASRRKKQEACRGPHYTDALAAQRIHDGTYHRSLSAYQCCPFKIPIDL